MSTALELALQRREPAFTRDFPRERGSSAVLWRLRANEEAFVCPDGGDGVDGGDLSAAKTVSGYSWFGLVQAKSGAPTHRHESPSGTSWLRTRVLAGWPGKGWFCV